MDSLELALIFMAGTLSGAVWVGLIIGFDATSPQITICEHYGMEKDSGSHTNDDYAYCVQELKTYNENGSYTVKEIHKAFLKKPKENIQPMPKTEKWGEMESNHPCCKFEQCGNWQPSNDLTDCVNVSCEGCKE